MSDHLGRDPMSEQSISLTVAQAEQVADALLSGCFLATDDAHSAEPGSLEHAAAENTYKALHAALRIVEGTLQRTANESL